MVYHTCIINGPSCSHEKCVENLDNELSDGQVAEQQVLKKYINDENTTVTLLQLEQEPASSNLTTWPFWPLNFEAPDPCAVGIDDSMVDSLTNHRSMAVTMDYGRIPCMIDEYWRPRQGHFTIELARVVRFGESFTVTSKLGRSSPNFPSKKTTYSTEMEMVDVFPRCQ